MITLLCPHGVPSSGGPRLDRQISSMVRLAHHRREQADGTDLHNVYLVTTILYYTKRGKLYQT